MKIRLAILFFAGCLSLGAQQYEAGAKVKPEYHRNEELLYHGNRYRVHNNYLTVGPGFLSSSIRNNSQKSIGLDFQFHIIRQHFQAGLMMSGETFGSNNNIQGHIGYGYRRETKTSNIAFFAGPSYQSGVTTGLDTVTGQIYPKFYDNYGIYFCLQGVVKYKYDLGFGAELVAEISAKQKIYGFRLIAYFSGAYRGPKRNYNPNVRSENPR